MDEAWIDERADRRLYLSGRTYPDHPIKRLCSTRNRFSKMEDSGTVTSQMLTQIPGKHERPSRRIAAFLLRGLRFVNKNGQPLKMMKPLKLDPALLEQPLYH